MNCNTILQPHLGKVATRYKNGDNISGYIALGKVIKVHHKFNSCDVQITKTNNLITSSPDMQGKFGARMCVSMAHYNRTTGASSGVIEPILEGQMVIVAFLDNKKAEPIIIGSIHNTWETQTSILPNEYPVDSYNESAKYLRVFPSQLYHKVDGYGGVEVCFPHTSFFVANSDIDNSISDIHLRFDHKDLSEKDPVTGDTRLGKDVESVQCNRMLFVHRSSYSESSCTWTKFFIDRDGSFRTTRDNNDNTLSYLEFTKSGAIKVVRQNDSPLRGAQKEGTEIGLYEDGRAFIERKMGGVHSTVEVASSGKVTLSVNNATISISPEGAITISTDADDGISLVSSKSSNKSSINITPRSIKIDSPSFTHSPCNCPIPS